MKRRKQYKRRILKGKRSRYTSLFSNAFKRDKYPSARITRIYKRGWY